MLTAILTGAAEVPGPGDSDGTGGARIELDKFEKLVCWEIKVTKITLPSIGAHIHQGTADVAGPIVVFLSPPDETGFSKGCTSVDLGLMEEILQNPTGFYVNVHTTDFPGGAIRGQLTIVRGAWEQDLVSPAEPELRQTSHAFAAAAPDTVVP